ncbi:hypothetical protein SynMITS9220_01321 [Synechococcus sp. MIT S9220]|nr:hypothetical protein SynMITS9220_01321 [Synechococcus sp. MIT S9220]
MISAAQVISSNLGRDLPHLFCKTHAVQLKAPKRSRRLPCRAS